MERFILRYEGAGEKPVDDLEKIRAVPKLKVVDDSSRMLLVEAPNDSVAGLIATLPEWKLTKEVFVPIPDPRPRVRQ
ncbi:MAG TPA: hypothetical protein VGW57_11175 [Chthoniobacterales bacterium]|nr:hypothetical protein [Chthoniobacterales bacterium]